MSSNLVRTGSADLAARAGGLALGYLLDRVVGDPPRCHPVAGFGRFAAAVEARVYRDSRCAGAAFLLLSAGGATLGAATVSRRSGPMRRLTSTALVTWAVLGGTTLTAVGEDMGAALEGGDLTRARALLPSLCGRDPAVLDEAGLARAAVESIAENTSDAAVAPLLWGALAGVPGLVAYRAVNTLDAMVGYRSERYRNFGWAAARADDLMNLAPARMSAVLVAALGGAPVRTAATWRRDARAHPSPNAGVVEAAIAGALGLGLGGPTVYRHGVEDRPALGRGAAPIAGDLRSVSRLSQRVQSAALMVSVTVVAARALTRRSGG